MKSKPEKIIEVEKIVEKTVEKIVEKIVVEEKIVDSDGQIRIALRWVPNIQRINKDDQKKHNNFVKRMQVKGYTDRQVRRLVEWFMRVQKSG